MPTVAVDDTRLFYDDRGKGAPILLIHGTGGSTNTLGDVAQRLAESHRVVSYDRRGFGRSEAPAPKPKDYLRRHVDDAATLLRELGAPNATVFGWSMGGVVALGLAARHPSAVSRLVVYEPPLHAKKNMTVSLARALGGAVMLTKMGRYERAAARFFRFTLAYDTGGNAFDELDAPTRKLLLASARSVMAEVDAGTGEELSRDEISRIRCPVGIIVGTRSAKFLQSAADRLAQYHPAARTHRLFGGDHVMSLRKPDVLVSAIRALMNDA